MNTQNEIRSRMSKNPVYFPEALSNTGADNNLLLNKVFEKQGINE